MRRKEQYQLEKWRNKVLERDNKMCQLCGVTDEEMQLHVHHIKKYSEHEDLRTDVDNGITLCVRCHEEIHGKEEEYEKVFVELLKNPIWIRENVEIETEMINYKDIDLIDCSTLDESFTKIPNDVFKLTNGNEFKVYSYLYYSYNKALGCSSPSMRTIAKNTNMSKNTVQRCIKGLEESGLIKIGKFENKTNKYTSNVYKVFIPIIKDEDDVS